MVELLPGVHPADISRNLSYLNRNSYIRSTGHGRATRYALAEGVSIPNSGASIPNKGPMSIPNNGASIPNNGASIPNNGASIPNSGASIPNSGASIPNNGVSIPNSGALGDMFPGRRFSERAVLLLTAYRCKKRHTPEEVEELVLELCREDWMRLVELAEILNRSPEYLRSRAVQILCRLGHLRRRHEELKHAEQAYRAV